MAGDDLDGGSADGGPTDDTPPIGSTLVTVDVRDLSGSDRANIPVTFGQVFVAGHLPAGVHLAGRTGGQGGVAVPIQVDEKASHADGSLRHAIITARIPTLAAGESQTVELVSTEAAPASGEVAVGDLLSSSFDAVVAIDIGGTTYRASARELLEAGARDAWLTGPMASEWLVSAPLRSDAADHPHLSARFHVRAYAGLDAARVDVIVENTWAMAVGPQNYTYDTTVVVGTETVLAEQGVPHYRQARWRRSFWWGADPDVHVAHDSSYMQLAGVVPTYDGSIVISDDALDAMHDEFLTNADLMEIGLVDPYMPGGGARRDIGPLPGWAATYVITQDSRAKETTLGISDQAGSFGIHHRDRATDLPISLDTYPDATVLGAPEFFPACGGDCSTPYTPDPSHQPSLSFVPYLVTGDYYHLEELHFWAGWNLYYNGDHGGSQGLLWGAWQQIRAIAWSLRTLGHAAYITPDDDAMKAYFTAKLENNLAHFDELFASNPPTPLGYVPNPPGGNLDADFSTWMDDFLTWSVGHLVQLGYSEARAFFDYKARFPVGRMTDPGYCWILASTYWPPARDESGELFSDWPTYLRAVIGAWEGSFRGTSELSPTDEEALIGAACDSSTMSSILGLSEGEMIGYAWGHSGYPSNLQPALAVSAELGAAGAAEAWSAFESRSVKPSGDGGYGVEPQWAVVPR